ENLATIALTQLVRPGVSIMYSTFVRSMDMKTMSVAMASPETAILKSMTAELGRYLDLPTMMPTCLRDSKIIDAQAGFETGMVGTIGAYNSDFLIGLQLDSDLLVDYADLPYTNECMEQFRRLVGKFDFNDKRIAMDNIKKVGHGESYLNSKHTAKNFRKELWVSDLTERGDWNAWKKDGGKSIAEKSEERVIQLLKQVKDVELLSKAICDKIDQIADGAGEKVKNIKR
ncbi:MAG: trimethylamine methyltransferase family protein, partial [Eubacterium sp.]